ncbi:MAG: metal-sensing transcriptional repressor [Proteobacteria bacterium]|nr:metal-sensing transcriptional repressor [Pseudomonadota bacterium]
MRQRVESDRYCVDSITRLAAVRAALAELMQVMRKFAR